MSATDAQRACGSDTIPHGKTSTSTQDKTEPLVDDHKLPHPFSAAGDIFQSTTALQQYYPLMTAPPSFRPWQSSGPGLEVSLHSPSSSPITARERSRSPASYTLRNRSPWPVRMSNTRASANGARWEGRLDGGTVGGFARLPPRKKIPLSDPASLVYGESDSGSDAGNSHKYPYETHRRREVVGEQRRRFIGHSDYDGEDGDYYSDDVDRRERMRMERRRYYDDRDMGEEYGALTERFGRIPAPVGLQRAAAGEGGRVKEDDGMDREGSRNRDRPPSYPLSIAGVRFSDLGFDPDWEGRKRWQLDGGSAWGKLYYQDIKQGDKEEGSTFRERTKLVSNRLDEDAETEEQEKETAETETISSNLPDEDDLVERSNWLGW